MSYAYSSEGKLNHWIFPLYGYSSLLVVGFSIVLAFILAPDVQNLEAIEETAYTIFLIVSAISLIISITLGIILYRNGTKVAKHEPVDAMRIPEPTLEYITDQHQMDEQQAIPVKLLEPEITQFCSNCG